MVDTITLMVRDDEIGKSLEDCDIGDEVTVKFKKTGHATAKISGEVLTMDAYKEEEPEANYEGEEETPTPPKSSGRKMPKAIEMIGAAK